MRTLGHVAPALAGALVLGLATPGLAEDPPADPAPADNPPVAQTRPAEVTPAMQEGSGTADETPAGAPDIALRTFAGNCLYPPAGADTQSGLLTSVASVLAPQLIGAAVDTLTKALDEAGKDKITTLSATLPLEYAPTCIQIARGVKLKSSDINGENLAQDLRQAPLLVEFYLRWSEDRTAISVMPTMVRYEQTIDGKKTSKTKRDLFATLTFSDPAGAKSVTVSVPLGAFAPTAGSGNRVFDAVGAPGLTWRGGTVYPTGAGASVWFPSVFLAPTSGGPPIETRAAANGGQANSGADADNLSIVTPVANAGPPPTTTGARTGATPSATDQTRARAQAPIVAPSMRRGAQIAPVSIVVSLRETRPGNPFAAALAGVFGGSKDKLVALGDPETIEAAKTASATAKNTAIQAYATALGDFYNKKGAYCLAVGAPTPDPLTLQQKAAELLSSEVKLLATVSAVGERPPFTQLVNPETGDGAGCPAA